MSPPLNGVVEEGQGNVSPVTTPSSLDVISQNSSALKERNYMGLSECSSDESSIISSLSEENKSNLNLATELRLGLPGSQSPVRNPQLCLLSIGNLDEKPLFPLVPSKDGISSSTVKTHVLGNKRGFSDTIGGFSEVKNTFAEGNWMFPAAGSDSEASQTIAQGKYSVNSGVNVMLSSRLCPNTGVKPVSVKDHTGAQPGMLKEILPLKGIQDRSHATNIESSHKQIAPDNNVNSPPASKAQVVGWPPIRSFRKNTLATTSKNNDEVDGKPGPGPLFIKVSMDGAPYLRKVDLRNYSAYKELSSALEKMFSCFTIGQCGSHGAPASEILSESKLRDLLHGSEYVLTYEDKDGDWMLVGDVPWEMFTDSCKRMRIMKSTDAIGLAPRAMEKCKSRN